MLSDLNELRRLAGIPLLEMSEVHSTDLPPVLFHGTSIFNLIGIVASNSLIEGAYWGKPNEPHGPRLTKSYDVATTFFSYATPDLGDESPGAVLVLDTQALDKSFQLIQYHDTGYDGSSFGEEEEVVPITEEISPLTNFLKSIIVTPEHAKYVIQDDILQYAIDWPYIDADSIEEARQLILNTLKSPAINKPY